MVQPSSVRLVTEAQLAAAVATALEDVNTDPLTTYAQVSALPDYPAVFPVDETTLGTKATLLSVGVVISGRIIVATTSTPAGMEAGDLVVVVP